MKRKNKTGLTIFIFAIIFLLLAGTLSAIFIYTTSPSWYPTQAEINDLLNNSTIQLSGSNVDGNSNIRIVPQEEINNNEGEGDDSITE